ncbi:carbohydrate ABC transporter permease, partial [Xanthomonas citri pv. citri]|nr:carbohydrate ABC transporter permease [Xanthomonas citri pv. citri]
MAQIVLSCLAAYGFVFFEFPLKKQLFMLVLVTTMIPGEVVVITNYVTVQNMGLIDTFAGLVLPSLISGTAIFLMRQYFL